MNSFHILVKSYGRNTGDLTERYKFRIIGQGISRVLLSHQATHTPAGAAFPIRKLWFLSPVHQGVQQGMPAPQTQTPHDPEASGLIEWWNSLLPFI